MARILIDARWLKATGIGRYTENILLQLVELKHDHELVLLVRPADLDDVPKPLRHLEIHTTDVLWYTPQEQVILPRLISKIKPDLVHFPQFNIPLQYRQPFVVTIHDLTMLRFKNIKGGLLAPFTYTLKDVVMRHVLKTAIKRSRVIFTPSQFVRDDVVQQYRVPADKILVTPNAADIPRLPDKIDLKHYGITGPFLLHVGNAYPNKNLVRAMHALGLINQGREVPLQLVLVGKKDAFHIGLEKLRDKLKLKDSVILTDRVSDNELVGLYRAASLYLLPSLSEGFGIPGLEAMSYDLPVVSSNASCLPEVFGDAVEYFDPKDEADMARAVTLVLDDPKRQKALMALGKKRVAQYSWRESAKTVLEGYDQALKSLTSPNPINRLLGRS